LALSSGGLVGCGGSSAKKDAGDGGGTDGGAGGGAGDAGKDQSPVDNKPPADMGAGGGGVDARDVGGMDVPDAGPTDGGGPIDAMPPAQLSAEVLDRRQTSFRLLWTAPSDGGNRAAAYQVRYAKVAITATNFADTTVTTAVPFTGTPGAPGSLEQMIISNLYIENDYYFAVAATNAGGTQVWMQATTAATTAHFNRSLFASTKANNEQLGYSLAADGDVNGDGLTDTLAGTYMGGAAYLYLGSNTVTPSAPTTTFTGLGTFFGAGVAQIGDIDNDGKQDIAISDPTNSTMTYVYIYKGRTTWPPTLSDTQADYKIGGPTYAGSVMGTSMARLGDFNGDGVDDFAIGARNFGSGVGQVVIVKGRAGLPAMITLPDTTNTITISGDATITQSLFGYRVLGLGHFYSATATSLVVSAPGPGSNPPPAASAGHVYAFHGQAGTAGAITLPADATTAGPAAGARIGLVLANLGPLLGTLPAVGLGNPSDSNIDNPNVAGAAYVMSGTTAAGPFMNKVLVNMTATSTAIGGVLLGGGVSGRDTTYSLIGDASADVLVAGEQGSPYSVVILDGAKLAAKGATVNAVSTAEVTLPLPAGWTTGEGAASLMPDVNGDGHPDFALGNSFGAVPGGVAIYW
jgi:hypothetical protein